MNFDEIEEFAKQKKKEHRMKIDKIKDAARRHNQERQGKKPYKILMEKYLYDARYLSE